MTVLTSDSGEKALQCDVFEEARRLEPDQFMTLTHQDGTFNYYVIGKAEQRDNDWIVPLQIVAEADEAEARRVGTVAHFAEGRDGSLE
ncbi:MAG TPA: hypothetical protein VNG71_03895 [Pyrinomonadaceae bacterium]|nr:hypothetical protein [Pyrinomonadaceae bacterium]